MLDQAARLRPRHADRPLARPKALILPHAGYIYSGPIAAEGYQLLAGHAGTIRRVVLIGPAHRVAFRGVALPGSRAFRTPLGEVPVDAAAVEQLAGLPQVIESPAAHASEHCLEVHLPFLQQLLGDFTVVPLLAGDVAPARVAEVLDRLWGGDETLILVSSDLSHYLPYDIGRRVDEQTCAHILGLQDAVSHEEACGATAILALLQVARWRGMAIELLRLASSGDTAGDRDRVVGYASFALYAPGTAADRSTLVDRAAFGQALVRHARSAIAAQLGSPGPAVLVPDEAQQPGASFVTLMLDGELRGCIGTLEAWRPLADDVAANAVAAALRDPRFPPVTPAELDRLRVEVSVLTPPEPFPVVDEADACRRLVPGVDGVILSAGIHRATFLPQVWEQLPDPAVFLAHLKHKAGLPAQGWPADLHLARYRVEKWVEAQEGAHHE